MAIIDILLFSSHQQRRCDNVTIIQLATDACTLYARRNEIAKTYHFGLQGIMYGGPKIPDDNSTSDSYIMT